MLAALSSNQKYWQKVSQVNTYSELLEFQMKRVITTLVCFWPTLIMNAASQRHVIHLSYAKTVLLHCEHLACLGISHDLQIAHLLRSLVYVKAFFPEMEVCVYAAQYGTCIQELEYRTGMCASLGFYFAMVILCNLYRPTHFVERDTLRVKHDRVHASSNPTL